MVPVLLLVPVSGCWKQASRNSFIRVHSDGGGWVPEAWWLTLRLFPDTQSM